MTPQRPSTLQFTWPAGTTAMLLALAGCASKPTALEQSLGESVRLAVQQQTVPATGLAGPLLTPGVIAVHGVDRYEQSYLRPPAPVNVLNIMAGSGNAAAAATSLPR